MNINLPIYYYIESLMMLNKVFYYNDQKSLTIHFEGVHKYL